MKPWPKLPTALTTVAEFDCEAYGPEGTRHAILCFFAAPGQRGCMDRAECHVALQLVRVRLLCRIQDLAAEEPDNTMWQYLAENFTSIDQLLQGASDDYEGCPGHTGPPDAGRIYRFQQGDTFYCDGTCRTDAAAE